MRLHWFWAVLAALALGSGLAWWTQLAREIHDHHADARRHAGERGERLDADAGPTIYRWVDAHGVVNLTTDKPPKGRHYTIVHIDPNQNVVPMSDDSRQKPATKRR